MKQYGLSADDLKFVRQKREAQLSYLENNFFQTSTGQIKSLLDVSFSANLSERYYSQLSNKINTMHALAVTQRLSPVFLTITLDGFFRGMLTGNYRKWNRQTDDQKTEYFRHIPNNEIHGFIGDKIRSEKPLTIKELYNVLNFQWFNFTKSYPFKKLKKQGKHFIYLKAAEPHKDGVPHFHVLLWIPQDSVDSFKSAFRTNFPAPRNHVEITGGNPGDTYGFQTAIFNPVGYIMKYATKSFMDLRSGEDLNYLQAWYVKHKIRRITTSHSTIPQWVYQKCYALESDWFHLTDLNIREPMLCEWSREDDYFILIEDSGRTIEYDSGLITLRYIDGPIIKQFGERSERLKTQSRQIEPVPSSWMKPKLPQRYTDVFIDGERFVLRPESVEFVFDLSPFDAIRIDQKFVFWLPKELRKIAPQPSKMKNYQLRQYFDGFDLQKVNLNHYEHTRSEMIKRDLLDPSENSIFNISWGLEYDL